MRKFGCFLLLVATTLHLQAQEKDYDTAAIVILDRMSSVIGDLNSVSFSIQVATDNMELENLVTHCANSKVFMVGPDKMLVDMHNDKGHKTFFYNGTSMSYYYFDENNYAVTDAPDNIIDAIDSVHETYGIDFPAADFFYPTFTDDFLGFCDRIEYIGQSMIDGEQCFHILGRGKDMNIQLWILSDATTLPKKMQINYLNSKVNKRYEAEFSNWNLNPDLPNAMFDFLPPPTANEVILLPVKE